ncbi:hypothetical protein [Klebsiella variicola]|nr:hypothetical protein [Klebsiella variicola]
MVELIFETEAERKIREGEVEFDFDDEDLLRLHQYHMDEDFHAQ